MKIKSLFTIQICTALISGHRSKYKAEDIELWLINRQHGRGWVKGGLLK